jgi:hypothetical protein
MQSLIDTIPEYCASEHFMFLDSTVKEHVESLLHHFCSGVGEPVTSESIDGALNALARLDVTADAKRAFPDLLRQFLEFASSTGRVPQAGQWVRFVDDAEAGFIGRLRDDGTLRGKTHRKAFADVGRNDPCPCGSGKKFKKCCIELLT